MRLQVLAAVQLSILSQETKLLDGQAATALIH